MGAIPQLRVIGSHVPAYTRCAHFEQINPLMRPAIKEGAAYEKLYYYIQLYPAMNHFRHPRYGKLSSSLRSDTLSAFEHQRNARLMNRSKYSWYPKRKFKGACIVTVADRSLSSKTLWYHICNQNSAMC